MEIIYVLGILGAFVLGAYTRKPFCFVKKEQPVPAKEEKEKPPKIVSEWNNMMNYTGNPQEETIDEN